jgi:hypothetical protein
MSLGLFLFLSAWQLISAHHDGAARRAAADILPRVQQGTCHWQIPSKGHCYNAAHAHPGLTAQQHARHLTNSLQLAYETVPSDYRSNYTIIVFSSDEFSTFLHATLAYFKLFFLLGSKVSSRSTSSLPPITESSTERENAEALLDVGIPAHLIVLTSQAQHVVAATYSTVLLLFDGVSLGALPTV